ncbi:hypothetical protein KY347_07010 [Candidatus Woesearchaeota archaeon]|nr:hypothetical protein [Candidatus Woesearchaeota archaeon]
MKKTILVVIFIVSILITIGCSPKTCDKPYILVRDDCCIDLNHNGVCDKDLEEDALKGSEEIEEYVYTEAEYKKNLDKLEEYKRDLDKLGKVCIFEPNVGGEFFIPPLIDCSSKQQCLDFVISEINDEMTKKELEENLNTECDTLTEKQKERYIAFKPEPKLLPPCYLPAGIVCTDFKLTADSTTVVLKNGMGYDAVDMNIITNGCTIPATGSLRNGEEKSFTVSGCLLVRGDRTIGSLNVTYTSSYTGVKHKMQGTLTTEVE